MSRLRWGHARALVGDPALPPRLSNLRLAVRVLQIVVWMHIHEVMHSRTSKSTNGDIASKIYCPLMCLGV